MTETKSCPLCKTNNGFSKNGMVYTCPACGEYMMDSVVRSLIEKGEKQDKLYLISAITRNYYEQHKDTGNRFEITFEMFSDDATFQAEFESKIPKSVLDKASLLLQYIARNSNEKPSTPVLIMPEIDYPIAFCKDKEELEFYIYHLFKRGFIQTTDNKKQTAFQNGLIEAEYQAILTVEGWVEIEKLQKPNLESKQAFVAMWLDPTMKEPFEKGILPLEDKNETGFKMLRVDQKHFNDKICDHIIADIKQSRFMIADCTELRPAVFFEAGYAMGMGLPVIFTCREGTDIKKCFDTDHYNHIVWKDAEDLKNKLKDRILATIGNAH